MSHTAAAAGSTVTVREHQVRANVARDRPSISDDGEETQLANFLLQKEILTEEQIQYLRMASDSGQNWKEQKTEAVTDSVETKTGLRLNQGAQGIVGIAIAIIATLMIGVVILGNIDQFADFGANNSWNSTAQSVTDSSQDTFDFLNLVPFLLVALFILGLMANRM